MTREHEGATFIIYYFQHKGDQSSINKAIYLDLRDTLQHLKGLKRNKKDENIISCTRLYVEPTDTLMVQSSERMILILIKE